MKSFLITLFALSSLALFSQRVEVYGGLNNNRFYDFKKEDPHFNSQYSPDWGGIAGIGISDLSAGWHKLRLTLSFEKYGGNINVYGGGLGAGSRIVVDMRKSVLALGVYPVNFSVIHRFDINIGIKISGLISESYEGKLYSGSSTGQSDTSYNLHDKYGRLSSSFVIGLEGRLAYNIKLSENYFLVPQYAFYLGLSQEFSDALKEVKSMRHYFCIGIVKKLK